MLNETRKDQLISFCRKMIQAKSYSGQENLAAAEMDAYAKANGFTMLHL